MTVKLTMAKVRCNRVIPAATPGMSEMVEFGAVYSSDPNHENKQWAQWTPSLSLQIAIDNPNAQGKFKEGEEYTLDFSKGDRGGGTGRRAGLRRNRIEPKAPRELRGHPNVWTL